MMNGGTIAALLVGLFALATIAVIVSKNAQTPTIINSAGQALTGVIGAAVSPVTGGNMGITG